MTEVCLSVSDLQKSLGESHGGSLPLFLSVRQSQQGMQHLPHISFTQANARQGSSGQLAPAQGSVICRLEAKLVFFNGVMGLLFGVSLTRPESQV